MDLVENTIGGHSPLPESVYIDKSPLHGMGIFAKVDIPKGHDFGITHVADERFTDGFVRTPMGGYVNHSDHPNTTMIIEKDIIRMYAARDIIKDEELTVDYRPWYKEDELATYR